MIFGLTTAISENISSSILSFGGIQPESQPGIDGSTDGQTVGLQLEMIEVRSVILKSIFFIYDYVSWLITRTTITLCRSGDWIGMKVLGGDRIILDTRKLWQMIPIKQKCHTTATFLDNQIFQFGQIWRFFTVVHQTAQWTIKKTDLFKTFSYKKSCCDIQFLLNWKHEPQFSGTYLEWLNWPPRLSCIFRPQIYTECNVSLGNIHELRKQDFGIFDPPPFPLVINSKHLATVAMNELLSLKNASALISLFFTWYE